MWINEADEQSRAATARWLGCPGERLQRNPIEVDVAREYSVWGEEENEVEGS